MKDLSPGPSEGLTKRKPGISRASLNTIFLRELWITVVVQHVQNGFLDHVYFTFAACQ
jgi:hypothetical protein